MQRNLAKIKRDYDDIDVKYGSEVQVLCDWVDTTNMVFIGGRGVAKSTVIIARRSRRLIDLMPGAPFAIVANTYSNLINNIMPAVQNGWKLQGLIEGVHYIKGRRSPESWRRKCSVIVDDYKYAYSFWNGCVLFLGSLDDPSLLAGKSVAHLIFDEVKFANETKAARVLPILRGDAITYGHCHLYGGVTITTDMPDITEGEYDWFFRYASEMDPQRIVAIVQTASILNGYLLKLERANREKKPDVRRIASIEAKVRYYEGALHKLRKGQTFFYNASSFANIDILTLEYAERMYSGALELHEFMKSVMGMKPTVRRSSRFYALFGDEHKYTDGTVNGGAAFMCSELRYLRSDLPLEGGMDFGKMTSLVVGQRDNSVIRILKNFYELPPGFIRELADQFLSFFATHKTKVLYLYYDRAGNNQQKQGLDYAGEVKRCIEFDANGVATGWRVELMSRGQGIIAQDAEYHFMLTLMKGDNKALPALLIDAVNCEELVSSIELATSYVKYKGTTKAIMKQKKSEKLPDKKLPKHSTNFSDAFKYLMMRRDWVKIVKNSTPSNTGADALADVFMARLIDKR